MFEVGQEVWCLIFGKGKIDSKHSGGASYPIQVVFENGEIESYTSEGCILERGNRTLYFSEPEVIGETEPRFIPELKSGTWVIAVNRQTHETSVFVVFEDRRHDVLLKKPYESDGIYTYRKDQYGFSRIDSCTSVYD